MTKTIAYLRVIVSDEMGASDFAVDNDGGLYTITIRREPTADKPDWFSTTLAHELGHFVDMASGKTTPDSVDAKGRLSEMLHSPAPLVADEKSAWRLARIIHPRLNRDIERTDLGTYGVKP